MSALLKSDVRLSVLSDLGNRFDDNLEAAHRELHSAQGATALSGQIAREIDALMSFVDDDVDKGVYDLVMAKKVKQYVTRARQIAANHEIQKSSFILMAQGKIQTLQESVALLRDLYNAEKKTHDVLVARVQEALSNNVPVDEVGRPLPSISQQRKEEARQESGTEAVSTSQPEAEPVKRRGRPRKS